jgi:adenosine deaminase
MLAISKNDLHIHLGGSWPMPFLESLGTDEEIAALRSFLGNIEQKSDTDYHKCFGAFALSAKIVNSNARIAAGTAALCRVMAGDGVTYSEIRTSLKDFGTGLEDYLLAVLQGVKEGCVGTILSVKIILSLKRSSSAEIANETLRLLIKYRNGEGGEVVGLDLSDNALVGDGSGIMGIIDEVHSQNIPVTLHLGECAEETAEQQVMELERIRPARIGHGVFLCDKAKQWVYDRRLPIEMCLSSSLMAHMVGSMDQHPALQLLKDGYPVAICTDDPLIFGTNHIKENEIAMELLGYSIEQMAEVHKRSLDFKFSASSA